MAPTGQLRAFETYLYNRAGTDADQLVVQIKKEFNLTNEQIKSLGATPLVVAEAKAGYIPQLVAVLASSDGSGTNRSGNQDTRIQYKIGDIFINDSERIDNKIMLGESEETQIVGVAPPKRTQSDIQIADLVGSSLVLGNTGDAEYGAGNNANANNARLIVWCNYLYVGLS